MFQKSFRVKTQNAIKGSDRKKLRAELGRCYPTIPVDRLAELVPNKEEMTVAKVYCQGGQNIIIYCLQKNPIFFDVNKIVYPTVYTLWQYPDLLPTFTTWPPVLTKLQGGADLMLPGLFVQGEVTPGALGHLQKGQTCSVKLRGNKCPVAVGYTTMSSRDMVQDAGMQGKGIIIVHVYGDQLWAFGEKTDLPSVEEPLFGLDEEEDEDEGEDGEANAVEEMGGSRKNENEEGCHLSRLVPETVPPVDADSATGGLTEISTLSLQEEGEEGATADDPPEQDPQDGRNSPEKMDDLLYQTFLCALKVSVKKSDLPLLTSTFYRSHMQPCCQHGENLDVKKSTYKKLSKFLAAMKAKGFLTLKQQKDVERITEIHKDHKELRGFDASSVDISQISGPDGAPDAAVGLKRPTITEMFMVTANTLPLFKAAGVNKGSALTAAEVRQVLIDYVKENNLHEMDNKGYVKLDPVLAHVLLNKNEYLELLRYEDLTTRCHSKMSLAHRICLPGQAPMLKKGKLEPVTINIAQRSGNKKVTLIDNLEVYGIDPAEFAHTVQVGVACSTSVSQLPGMRRGQQVLIQGNQVTFIADLLLDKYHLQRKWIIGLEKAPKGKRK